MCVCVRRKGCFLPPPPLTHTYKHAHTQVAWEGWRTLRLQLMDWKSVCEESEMVWECLCLRECICVYVYGHVCVCVCVSVCVCLLFLFSLSLCVCVCVCVCVCKSLFILADWCISNMAMRVVLFKIFRRSAHTSQTSPSHLHSTTDDFSWSFAIQDHTFHPR